MDANDREMQRIREAHEQQCLGDQGEFIAQRDGEQAEPSHQVRHGLVEGKEPQGFILTEM